jgi:nicotinate-nucleotide adenylyltransferase
LSSGILGGTFDPIHLGHLRLAEEVGEALELDHMYLIPAALPPHKNSRPVSPFRHRMAMTRIAAEASPILEALDLEGRRQGLSYSIETLKEFHQILKKDSDIFFILGMDAFLEIGTWKDYKKLFDYAHFLVIDRPGSQAEDLGRFLVSLDVGFRREENENTFVVPSGNRLIFKEVTLMAISSTDIRERVARGLSIRFLVLESVRAYILKNGLYGVYGDTR